MPASSPDFRTQIAEYLWTFPRSYKVVDLGAGEGTYADLLAGHFHYIHAIEACQDYVDKYNLESKYTDVFVQDVCGIKVIGVYDIAILGGVLEHLSVECATNLLYRLSEDCTEIIVKVPYTTPQGEVNGNPYEVHIQNDLTHNIVLERYPMLDSWLSNARCGVYRLKRESKTIHYGDTSYYKDD